MLSDSEDESANSFGVAVGSIPFARGQAQRDPAMPDPSYVVRCEAVRGPILTRVEEEALRSVQYYFQDVSGVGNVRHVEFVTV